MSLSPLKAAALGAAALMLAACGEEPVESSDAAPAADQAETPAVNPVSGDAAISAVPLRAASQDDPFVQAGYAVGDIVLGDPNAPVTLIEYASLTCPHCADFHNDSLPTIKDEYVDAGKVRLVVREVYFDQFGLFASAISRCGGEQRFHAYLDVFFKQQSQWIGDGNPESILEEIRRIGRFGGLSEERVNACLDDQPFLNQLLQNYQAAAEADGVQSTPFFLVNGEPVRGNVGLDQMRAVIDSKLGG